MFLPEPASLDELELFQESYLSSFWAFVMAEIIYSISDPFYLLNHFLTALGQLSQSYLLTLFYYFTILRSRMSHMFGSCSCSSLAPDSPSFSSFSSLRSLQICPLFLKYELLSFQSFRAALFSFLWAFRLLVVSFHSPQSLPTASSYSYVLHAFLLCLNILLLMLVRTLSQAY